jgi:DNA-binding IclR family transcriptional regulator
MYTMTIELKASRDERTAVDKAVSLILAFGSDSRSSLGVSELARRTGLSKSTAFRLLSMLERNQVFVRVGTGYRLGSLLADIGSGEQAAHDALRDSLTPHLMDLYDRTHQTVHLAVIHGPEVVYLNKLQGPRAPSSPSRIGGHAPAYATAIGKVLLAWNPDSIDQTVGAPFVPWTPNTIKTEEQLLATLQEVRRTGVAFDRDESLVGLSCIAAPIVGRSGRPVAAFSISFPTGSTAGESYAHALRTVCYAASQALKTVSRPVALVRA